jgi:RNA-dependent RNA polymerase
MIPASERIARLERLALRIQGQRFPDLALLLLECHHQQPDEDAAVLKRSRPPNTAPVRFVTLTPTKLVFQTPKDMIRNRITRSFNPEYFLRVHFRDEDLLRLSSVRSEASLKNLLARVEGLLASGIAVGGRQFDFLAMSSSQLRDHGCWFVAPHEGGPGEGLWDADRIRAWCGDLSSIKNVAKFVARLGQSLSASQDTVHSSPEDWQLLPDVCVTSEKADGQPKEYTFTDGIGMISPALAREVAQALGMSPVPSAFQIRFAGFKGVVAANPNVCPEDPLRRLWLRPSMKKFDSPHRVLEVLNTTQYIACHLNRQVVMILSGLGVPDEAFLRLQDAMLARMGRMLLEGGTGSRFLAQNCHCLPPLPFGHQPAFDAALTMEPFFRSLILAAYQRQMAELLTRSRVFLPRARILMGTIDETGSLEPDQVFVQCSRVPTDDECASNAFIWDEERNLFTVLGAVTIAKNPCMHPGDVRRLSAVDHPALRRTHFDCVVFPAKGPRPLTDMCSGSDLDGDLYFVAWDPALLPPATYPPMEYDAPKATVVEGPIGLPHIRRFLVDFIANDQLGMLANAHVAHVDHKPLGVCDPICMRLAYLFSMSVDFPKTGFIPDFPKEAKVALWPDFMQKTDLPGYPSQKVIGRMFRKVRAIAGATPKHINLAWLVRPNPRLVIDGHQVATCPFRPSAYYSPLRNTWRRQGCSMASMRRPWASSSVSTASTARPRSLRGRCPRSAASPRTTSKPPSTYEPFRLPPALKWVYIGGEDQGEWAAEDV